MSSLRVAFLSGFVLELTAAVATALVAVEVGLRLLAGHVSYQTALLVLLLTPEAYLPLRALGAQFHASAEGAAAGKSTLAAVLLRFVNLSSGTVLLIGRDLAGYDPDDIHGVVGGCAQDPHIFDTTIRDNLRLARPQASDAELADAATRGPAARLDRLAAPRLTFKGRHDRHAESPDRRSWPSGRLCSPCVG
jgi:ABC-type transport system involved in cytochrome bd biosynthesis fused ATPase/permease subunit